MKKAKNKQQPSPFSKKVIALIAGIPEGKVATYGQLAKLAGNPQASRGVSWILHSCSRAYRLPWQRVVGAKGKIFFPWGSPGFVRQRKLLEEEGIEPNESGQVDLEKFQWKRKR